MKKLKMLLAVLSMLTGLFMTCITVAASNGRFRFNPSVLEDWLWYGTILILISAPIRWFVKRYKEKNINQTTSPSKS